MELISKPEDWAVELYEDTLFNGDYKLSDYCIVEEYDNGYILFHTITWTILYLTKEEFENRFNSTFLLSNKIIVNKNIDETDIAEKAYINRAYIDVKDKFKNVNNFVILTTNECNANCPYCYEVLKKGKMSKETADDLLDFIEKKHNGKVAITWFGGEPLMNTDIMDYITTKLVEKEIKYSTSIISNTFNFTEDIIEKAVNLWKINHLQVTLDGPSEYYNKIKNFDYNGDSFDFVLNNVQNILEKTKIGISIRINVSDENIDMVEELFSVLKDRFNDYMKSRIKFDIHEVFQMYDEPNTEKVHLDLNLYEAYARGFLGACGQALTQTELETLPDGARLMTLECGMRFLTDYLQGDVYFHTACEDHNLVRCRTQFKMVQSMEEQAAEYEAIVREVARG